MLDYVLQYSLIFFFLKIVLILVILEKMLRKINFITFIYFSKTYIYVINSINL